MKKQGIRNSYLTKLFTYFMVLFSLLIVTIIVINIQSLAVIKKQTILSNQSTTTRMFQLIDSMADEMSNTCMKISTVKELEMYAQAAIREDQSLPYKRYVLQNLLSGYREENMEDLFVYYPQDGYIISGYRSSLLAEKYFEVYYNEAGEDAADSYYNSDFFSGTPKFHMIGDGIDNGYLCLSMKYKRGKNQADYVLTVVLDCEYLKSLIGGDYSDKSGCFMIFNGNKELVLAEDDEIALCNLDGYSGSSEPYEAKFGGKNYVMQVYEAKEIEGYYGYAIPYDFFWEQLAQMRAFGVISIVICALVGFVLAFGMSRKAYSPLKTMVSNLQGEKKELTSNDIAEFEFLNELFRNANEEKRKLRSEVKETREGKRDKFISRILEGNVFFEENCDDVFRKYGVPCCSDQFVVGIIQLDSEQEEGIDKFFIIQNVFEEIFNRDNKGYVLSLMDRKYVFLLNLSISEKKERIADMLEEGQDFLQRNFGFELSIGYSQVNEGMQGIHKAYEEARITMDYHYILGKGNTVAYSSIKDREFSYLNSDKPILPAMLEDFLNNASQDVSEFVARIFKNYGIDDKISLDTMECFKFDVINAVNRVGLQHSFSIEERQSSIFELIRKDSLQEFGECLKNVLMKFRQKKLEMENSNGICQQARKYIEDHYDDINLSLPMLGDAMNLSTSYLSKRYKEQYGVSIFYDITQVRLEKVKQLLQGTEISINEIAEQTGFSNGKVLIRAFKKKEGITPGRYRELINEQERNV